MSAPILARVARAGQLARQAVRALLPAGDVASAPATAFDFQTGGFFAHRRMSPSEVRSILEQAAYGSLNYQWDMFALMEDTWPRLAKNLAELRRAASRATYAVSPYAERGAKPTQSAMDRSAAVDQALRQWWPRPGTMELGFEDTLFHALDAYGKGISALEVHWNQTPGGVLPRCSHVLARQRYGWNADGTELGLLETATGWQPFPPDHFLVGIWQARTGAPGATAVLRALAPYWVGITFGWEWLLSNAQIFGVPFRWATFDKNQPNLGAQLRDMLAAMGASGYGAFPDGTKLEFKEASQNAHGNPQVMIQEMADKACDLLILGQELSGGAHAGGLGSGASKLQGGVRADRLEAATQWCSDLLNYQLVPAVLRANFGDLTEPPTIAGDVDDEADELKMAQRDQIFLAAGVELPRAWFYDRHGIPQPVDGEPTLTGRPGTPAPGDAPPGGGAPGEAPAGGEPAVQAKAAFADPDHESNVLAFTARAAAQLGAVDKKALGPILNRLAKIEAIADPAEQLAALKQFHSDLPTLAAGLLSHTPAAAAVLANVIGPSVVSGFATATAEKTKNAP